MTVMAQLKEATWPAHRQLEKRLATQERFTDMSRYQDHIAQLLAFYTEAETAWEEWLDPVLIDLPARRKAHLLKDDLHAIGGSFSSTAVVIPRVSDSASALGGFYVLEGATLGGHYLLPLVQRNFGLSAAYGASYFASYGSEARVMWQRFGSVVEKYCQSTTARKRAITTATNTFLALEHCLLGATT